jgi:phosphoribosylformimino-5-aminoimidazole carboxamide ribonucleotide (ProFAR) isomerase
LVKAGASRVIVGTAAFDEAGVRRGFLEELVAAVGKERILLALDSKGGRIVVKGWQEATKFEAEAVIRELEPFCGGFLCTYVDKEGMLQGTDLDWYRRLRGCTDHELTAAGGITTLDEIDELTSLGIHAALGMAVYTGRLKLQDLRRYSE